MHPIKALRQKQKNEASQENTTKTLKLNQNIVTERG